MLHVRAADNKCHVLLLFSQPIISASVTSVEQLNLNDTKGRYRSQAEQVEQRPSESNALSCDAKVNNTALLLPFLPPLSKRRMILKKPRAADDHQQNKSKKTVTTPPAHHHDHPFSVLSAVNLPRSSSFSELTRYLRKSTEIYTSPSIISSSSQTAMTITLTENLLNWTQK